MKKTMRCLAATVFALALGGLSAMAADDWGTLIADYEKLVDQIIQIHSKVKEGNYDAATELAPLSLKCQELSGKIMQSQQTELTPEQIKRFQLIAEKLRKAVSAPVTP